MLAVRGEVCVALHAECGARQVVRGPLEMEGAGLSADCASCSWSPAVRSALRLRFPATLRCPAATWFGKLVGTEQLEAPDPARKAGAAS